MFTVCKLYVYETVCSGIFWSGQLTYSFSLFAQHTRMFNKPMWSLRLLVSITSNNISFDNPLLHKSKASPFQNVT